MMELKLYLQGGLILLGLLTVYFFIGDWIGQLFRVRTRFSIAVVVGFAADFAFFELIALPFLLVHGRFSVLFVLAILFTAAAWLYGIWQFFKKKRYRCYHNKKWYRCCCGKKQSEKWEVMLLVLLVVVVLFQCFCSSYYQHEDADDSYFITVSNIALEQDRVITEERYCITGHELFREGFRPQLTSWEIYLAVLSRLFGVGPAAFAHSYLPFFLILLCYFSVHALAVNLFDNVNKQRVFVLVTAVLNLFGGVCVYTGSMFLLVRIWQGKAMLCNFLLPLLYAVFADIYRKGLKYPYQWISFAGLFVLGVAFAPIGFYLVPIAGFLLMTSYIGYMLAEKAEEVKPLLKKLTLFGGVLLVILLAVFLKVVGSGSGNAYIRGMGEGASWSATFRQVYSSWLYPVLFVLFSLQLVLSWKRNKDKIFLFLGSTVVLFVTFLNPLLARPVSVFVTGVGVYWRLYWLVPVLPICAFILADQAGEEGKGLHLVVNILALGILVLWEGTCVYEKGLYFTESAGVEKFWPETYAAFGYLEDTGGYEGKMMIGPEKITCQLRQCTSLVQVPRPRDMASLYLPLVWEGFNEHSYEFNVYSYDDLYRDIYGNHDISSRKAIEGLEYLKAEYIFAEQELNTGEAPYECVDVREGVYIYRHIALESTAKLVHDTEYGS